MQILFFDEYNISKNELLKCIFIYKNMFMLREIYIYIYICKSLFIEIRIIL